VLILEQRQIPHIAAIATLLLSAACSDELPSAGSGAWGGPVGVVTEPVRLQPLIDEIQALGTARANESVEIRPRIASLVTRIRFDEGQLVEAGELLLELENSEIVAGLALAEAQLTESRSLYDRSKNLESTQAISASNLEELLAQVKVDEASVEAARARLELTRIHAPFSGRVGLRRISPGSFVDTSTTITTLDDVSRIKLDFSVPETFLNVVSTGMKIVARNIVFPDRDFEGTVMSIDTRLDPVSRAVQVRAIVPNDDGYLKPGMFMTVDLQRDLGDVLLAPEQAIVPEGSQQFVFVVNEGVVEKRGVTLGRRVPGYVVVSEGLSEGESIITEGTQKVRDGSDVDIVEHAAASSETAR
jgi:membrane fusion protein (multidrug efflux system)